MVHTFYQKAQRAVKRIFTFSAAKTQQEQKKKSGGERTEIKNREEGTLCREQSVPRGDLPAETQGEQKQKAPGKKKWRPEDFRVDPLPGKTRFCDLGLPDEILHAIADLDFQYCTPIQAEALPHLLKGLDLVGHANTGTGKTAVFLVALLAKLRNKKREKKTGVKGLILAPTRELVVQIVKDGRKLARYSGVSIHAIYGGADYVKQQALLEEGRCDIIAATPGRLLDFMGKGIFNLKECSTLVIDEADRMLDMGFIPDVRRIVHHLPNRGERQTLMFSATITDDVKRLASQWCSKPASVSIATENVVVGTVQQIVYLVTGEEKFTVLYNILKKNSGKRIAVFANQKREASRLADRLQRSGIDCVLLSGDVPQAKRQARLERFRQGSSSVLVATDVAGRGLHIDDITHVVNYTLPYEPEDYVHRIGRTGRAGHEGISIAFACEEGSFVLPDIEEYIGQKLECILPEEELLVPPPQPRKTTSRNTQGESGNASSAARKRRPRRRPRRPQNTSPVNHGKP